MSSSFASNPRKRIFLVEGSSMLREELTLALQELAPVTVVGAAASSQEAKAWMDERTQACDVIIVDLLLMPGSGLDVLRHMTGYREPPERLVLTNDATVDMRARCMALGAQAVFDKSTEIDALVERLCA